MGFVTGRSLGGASVRRCCWLKQRLAIERFLVDFSVTGNAAVHVESRRFRVEVAADALRVVAVVLDCCFAVASVVSDVLCMCGLARLRSVLSTPVGLELIE